MQACGSWDQQTNAPQEAHQEALPSGRRQIAQGPSEGIEGAGGPAGGRLRADNGRELAAPAPGARRAPLCGIGEGAGASATSSRALLVTTTVLVLLERSKAIGASPRAAGPARGEWRRDVAPPLGLGLARLAFVGSTFDALARFVLA